MARTLSVWPLRDRRLVPETPDLGVVARSKPLPLGIHRDGGRSKPFTANALQAKIRPGSPLHCTLGQARQDKMRLLSDGKRRGVSVLAMLDGNRMVYT